MTAVPNTMNTKSLAEQLLAAEWEEHDARVLIERLAGEVEEADRDAVLRAAFAEEWRDLVGMIREVETLALPAADRGLWADMVGTAADTAAAAHLAAQLATAVALDAAWQLHAAKCQLESVVGEVARLRVLIKPVGAR